MGKLYGEAVVDVNDAAHTFEYYAGLVMESGGETLEVPGDTLSMVVREPIGVTVGITPWNYPLLMAAWKAAPALAAGNVMILKPASVSPLTTLELARILDEAGLPEGRLPGAHRLRRRDRRLPRRAPAGRHGRLHRLRGRRQVRSCAAAPRT